MNLTDCLSHCIRVAKPEGLVNLTCTNQCYDVSGWRYSDGAPVWYAAAAAGALTFAAVISCITSSLLGLDTSMLHSILDLQVNRVEEDKKLWRMQKRAKKVLRLRKRGSLLFCSLLIASTASSVALVLLLASTVGSMWAMGLSTMLLVLLVEIIPPALCANNALHIASATSFISKILMLVLSPVAFPLAFMLDIFLFPWPLPDKDHPPPPNPTTFSETRVNKLDQDIRSTTRPPDPLPENSRQPPAGPSQTRESKTIPRTPTIGLTAAAHHLETGSPNRPPRRMRATLAEPPMDPRLNNIDFATAGITLFQQHSELNHMYGFDLPSGGDIPSTPCNCSWWGKGCPKCRKTTSPSFSPASWWSNRSPPPRKHPSSSIEVGSVLGDSESGWDPDSSYSTGKGGVGQRSSQIRVVDTSGVKSSTMGYGELRSPGEGMNQRVNWWLGGMKFWSQEAGVVEEERGGGSGASGRGKGTRISRRSKRRSSSLDTNIGVGEEEEELSQGQMRLLGRSLPLLSMGVVKGEGGLTTWKQPGFSSEEKEQVVRRGLSDGDEPESALQKSQLEVLDESTSFPLDGAEDPYITDGATARNNRQRISPAWSDPPTFGRRGRRRGWSMASSGSQRSVGEASLDAWLSDSSDDPDKSAVGPHRAPRWARNASKRYHTGETDSQGTHRGGGSQLDPWGLGPPPLNSTLPKARSTWWLPSRRLFWRPDRRVQNPLSLPPIGAPPPSLVGKTKTPPLSHLPATWGDGAGPGAGGAFRMVRIAEERCQHCDETDNQNRKRKSLEEVVEHSLPLGAETNRRYNNSSHHVEHARSQRRSSNHSVDNGGTHAHRRDSIDNLGLHYHHRKGVDNSSAHLHRVRDNGVGGDRTRSTQQRRNSDGGEDKSAADIRISIDDARARAGVAAWSSAWREAREAAAGRSGRGSGRGLGSQAAFSAPRERMLPRDSEDLPLSRTGGRSAGGLGRWSASGVGSVSEWMRATGSVALEEIAVERTAAQENVEPTIQAVSEASKIGVAEGNVEEAKESGPAMEFPEGEFGAVMARVREETTTATVGTDRDEEEDSLMSPGRRTALRIGGSGECTMRKDDGIPSWTDETVPTTEAKKDDGNPSRTDDSVPTSEAQGGGDTWPTAASIFPPPNRRDLDKLVQATYVSIGWPSSTQHPAPRPPRSASLSSVPTPRPNPSSLPPPHSTPRQHPHSPPNLTIPRQPDFDRRRSMDSATFDSDIGDLSLGSLWTSGQTSQVQSIPAIHTLNPNSPFSLPLSASSTPAFSGSQAWEPAMTQNLNLGSHARSWAPREDPEHASALSWRFAGEGEKAERSEEKGKAARGLSTGWPMHLSERETTDTRDSLRMVPAGDESYTDVREAEGGKETRSSEMVPGSFGSFGAGGNVLARLEVGRGGEAIGTGEGKGEVGDDRRGREVEGSMRGVSGLRGISVKGSSPRAGSGTTSRAGSGRTSRAGSGAIGEDLEMENSFWSEVSAVDVAEGEFGSGRWEKWGSPRGWNWQPRGVTSKDSDEDSAGMISVDIQGGWSPGASSDIGGELRDGWDRSPRVGLGGRPNRGSERGRSLLSHSTLPTRQNSLP